MSTIPTDISQRQFQKYVLPHLTTAKRGFVCKIPLYKVFNYILYRLHTGCQWKRLPIDPDPDNPEKVEVYKPRFTAERTFAWVDKFKQLLIRFERKDAYWLGAHFIAFTMINLRHLLA